MPKYRLAFLAAGVLVLAVAASASGRSYTNIKPPGKIAKAG